MSAADKSLSIDRKPDSGTHRTVRANAGTAGLDGQTIARFEVALGDNLANLWALERRKETTVSPNTAPSVAALSGPSQSAESRTGVDAAVEKIVANALTRLPCGAGHHRLIRVTQCATRPSGRCGVLSTSFCGWARFSR